MIELYEYLIAFPIIIGLFYLHEVGHGIECYRQTGNFGKIRVIWKQLTMKHYGEGGIYNSKKYGIAGGTIAGIVGLTLSYAFTGIYKPLELSLFMGGLMNLLYAPFESLFQMKMNEKNYRYGRYAIYGVAIIFSLLIYLG